MSKQSSISSFLTTNKDSVQRCVESVDNGLKFKCPYCPKSFFKQGLLSHVRSHPLGSIVYKKRSTGKVKIRGDLYSNKGGKNDAF